MEEYLKEEEIKIEYYDIPETDPLCEKLEEDSIGNFNVSNEIVSDNTKQCEINPDATSQINWYREIDDCGKFVCQFCDLTYSTVQTIRHHVKTKHPAEANTMKNIIRNKKRNPKIKCHICKKTFKDINTLKDHINEHHSENYLTSCKVCFAAFNNAQEMTEHIYHEHQKLTNMKTYSCSFCGYRTQKLSHFKQHRNTHMPTKQMRCESCDYATNYLPNLKIHQRIHTNYKPYLCTFGNCGYRCSAKSALRSHQLKHNPEANMLYCDKCIYGTVYKSSLKKHIDSHKRNSLKLL